MICRQALRPDQKLRALVFDTSQHGSKPMIEENSKASAEKEEYKHIDPLSSFQDREGRDCASPPELAKVRVERLFGNRPMTIMLKLGLPSLAGICCGLALWVTVISEAASYLSDSPQTCVNCHVMRSAYASWEHSSHREVATCNDCHVPHGNFFKSWAFKARDGLWHATVFTFRWEPQVIQLSLRAIPVVQENCRRCHEAQISETHLAYRDDYGTRCWDCHISPHGEVQSLSTIVHWLQSTD